MFEDLRGRSPFFGSSRLVCQQGVQTRTIKSWPLRSRCLLRRSSLAPNGPSLILHCHKAFKQMILYELVGFLLVCGLFQTQTGRELHSIQQASSCCSALEEEERGFLIIQWVSSPSITSRWILQTQGASL